MRLKYTRDYWATEQPLTKPKRIVYVQYTNPAAYPPLEHSSGILAESGWKVLFLGTGALGANKLQFPERENIRVRQMAFQRAGWRQKVHFALFHLWCLGWLLRERPSWVYVSELFACPFGWLASLAGIRMVFHEHDTPGPNGSGAFTKLLFWTRKQCAVNADICVVPNRMRGEYLMESTGLALPPVVVWNCPSIRESVSQRVDTKADRLRLLYHGSIVPERLPLSVIDAIASLPAGVSLTVVGYETVGALDYIGVLRRRAAELGIADRLHIVGTLATREELMSVCRQHDVGLSLMPLDSGDLNMGSMAGASNKPYDYLACGLALLVSTLPDWEEIFVKSGYGLSCNPSSPESVAAAIRTFAAQPETTRTMGERGRQRVIDEWNYEYQFRPVLDVLVGTGPSPSDALARTEASLKPKAVR
jgi:glycosyltransferase involved in cell wall biosynthesis